MIWNADPDPIGDLEAFIQETEDKTGLEVQQDMTEEEVKLAWVAFKHELAQSIYLHGGTSQDVIDMIDLVQGGIMTRIAIVYYSINHRKLGVIDITGTEFEVPADSAKELIKRIIDNQHFILLTSTGYCIVPYHQIISITVEE